MKNTLLFSLFSCFCLFRCTPSAPEKVVDIKSGPSVEWYSTDVPNLIKEANAIQTLASGFQWSEGPVWIKEEQRLLFTDVPNNVIYSWTAQDSITVFMKPSGYFDTVPTNREMGANGLLRDDLGNLFICQHGERRIAMMPYPFPEDRNTAVVVTSYNGKRFNSPNDITKDNDGVLYFTDPPYGLEKQEEDSTKELSFQGVFRLYKNTATLLIDSLSRPNGVLYIPETKELWVSNSDPHKAIISKYTVQPDGKLSNGKIVFDATALVGSNKGLPDGMAYHSKGYVFCTGPGGVFVFDVKGVLLGKIHLPVATSNVTLDDTENFLFITAHMHLMRVSLVP